MTPRLMGTPLWGFDVGLGMASKMTVFLDDYYTLVCNLVA